MAIEKITGSNIGNGEGILSSVVGEARKHIQLKSLVAGNNVSLTSDDFTITISQGGGAGEANTTSNAGTGEGTLAKAKSGVDLPIKSLKQGTNITLTNNADDVTINAVGGSGEVNSGVNVGTSGVGVFLTKSGVDLRFAKLNPNDPKVLIALSGSQIDFSLSTSAYCSTGHDQTETNNLVTALATKVESGLNMGTSGIGIFSKKSGTQLEFNRLNPLSNRVNIALSGNQIDLDVNQNNLTLQNLTGKSTATQHSFEYTSSFLGTQVNLTANTYATGPSINISTGTWMIWGWVTVESNTAVANQATAKLWNGSANPPATTMAAAPSQGTNLRGYLSMSLQTVQTLSTTATWVISVAAVGANSVIKAIPALNAPTGTAASMIHALRIG